MKNGTTPETVAQTVDNCLPGLLPQHLADLRKSGLTDATIRAAGIRSEFSLAAVKALLDTKQFAQRCLPVMVFPYVDADGKNGYCRIKPDHPRESGGRPVKYESPRGQPNRIYLPPGVAEVLDNQGRELLLTEGEKKSLAASQAGFPAIGLVGVNGYKPRGKVTLLPALERIAWNGRQVRVVFDSDIATNPDVQAAESQLAALLKARGAVVKVVRLPQGELDSAGKPVKVGLDDFLVACQARGLHPAGELRKLLDAAQEPDEPDGGTIKQAASEIDPVPEASAFLESTELDGVPRLRFYRGTWIYWHGGAYSELPPSEVRGQLIEHLDRDYYKLSASAVSNVLDGLRAKARLPHFTEPPAWLGDAPPWHPADVIVCRNGMIHLPTLTAGKPDFMLPATPRYFTSAALPYDFVGDAPEPREWLRRLDEWWGGDAYSIGALQEWIGYCLTLDTRQQKICYWVGPTRSGKGTAARVIRALAGPANCCGPTLASLGGTFGLWPLLGKSLAIVSDARLGGRTDSQVVIERMLSISGEDALTVDRKNLEPMTVKLPTRLMIFSNELPRLSDSSGALVGRMLLLRQTKSFFGSEDTGLTDRLLNELPGILLWAIEGWRRLRDRGRFVQPAAAVGMLSDMKDLASPVGEFVRMCCVVEAGRRIPRTELYAAFKLWSESKGRGRIEDSTAFGRSLRAAVPEVGDSQPRFNGDKVRCYEGIALASVE